MDEAEGTHPAGLKHSSGEVRRRGPFHQTFFPSNLTVLVQGSYAVPGWTTLVCYRKHQIEMLRCRGGGRRKLLGTEMRETCSDHQPLVAIYLYDGNIYSGTNMVGNF